MLCTTDLSTGFVLGLTRRLCYESHRNCLVSTAWWSSTDLLSAAVNVNWISDVTFFDIAVSCDCCSVSYVVVPLSNLGTATQTGLFMVSYTPFSYRHMHRTPHIVLVGSANIIWSRLCLYHRLCPTHRCGLMPFKKTWHNSRLATCLIIVTVLTHAGIMTNTKSNNGSRAKCGNNSS